MSDSTRRVLPVVRWLQVGAAAAGLGMAFGMAALAAPAVASADDNAASSSADSARPSAARSGSSGVKHRPTVRSAASRANGPARAAAGTSAKKVPAPSSAVAGILKSRTQASTTAPAPAPSAAPSIGYVRTLTRLNLNDLFSGTGHTVAVNPTATVTGLFNQVLRKDPTQEELQQYLNLWTRRGVNAVVAGLYTSTAFRESEVTNYYLELLGRAPTPLELSRGTTQLKLGKPEPQFAAEIVGSPNFSAASAYGGPDKWQPGSVTVPNATTVVSQMYRTMLGTTPDPLTAPTYVEQLASGRSQERVAREFVNSDPFRQAKIQEVYAAMGQTATPEQIATAVQNWQRDGGLAGIATALLAASTNVTRIEAGAVKLPNMTAVTQLQSLLLAQYTEAADGFVNLFNTLRITDPATGLPTCKVTCNAPLMDLIRTGGAFRGLADSSIVITDFKADTSKLVPTQNEVDIDKSLAYPLTHPDQLAEYLNGGYISSQQIITANNGTTIVDGHHRWSGLYVINPDTQIASYDLGYTESGKEALQETQMGIAAKDGILPQQFVTPGLNLFTMGEAQFKARVVDLIDKGVLPELPPHPVEIRATFLALRGLATDAEITEFLWQNVLRMRAGNQPIPGATGRGFMPQPDPYDEVFAWMQGGNLSYSFPIIAFIG